VVYSKAKSKEYGWRNLTQKVILADGRHIYETKDYNDYTKGYLHTNAYCRPSCYDCKFKGFPRIADITLADFWGIENVDKSMDKNLGTSLVMVNSKKGEAFFEKAKARAKTVKVSFDSILPRNPALIKPLPSSKVNREQFFEDLDNMTFTELAKKYIKETPITRKQKIKHFVRTCFRLIKMPFGEMSLFYCLKYNKFSQLYSNIYFAPYKHSVLQINKQANFNVNGLFTFGSKRIKRAKLESRMLIEKGATMEVNGRFNVLYGADIEVFQDAKLVIHGQGGANINFTCICGEYIELGKDVMIGRNVTIRDNNGGHYINRTGYKNTKPVIIGNKVWLCEGCTIMPGVKIGDGAIIGAHAFVTQNVPAHSLVIGNPAQVVDTDVLWKY